MHRGYPCRALCAAQYREMTIGERLKPTVDAAGEGRDKAVNEVRGRLNRLLHTSR